MENVVAGEKKGPGHFQAYKLSHKASELIGIHDQDCFEFARAEGAEQDAVATRHNLSKRDLVEYIELLETRAGIAGTVAYRF